MATEAEIAERVTRDRLAQGLPEVITDPVALDTVAALLRPEPKPKSKRRQR